MSIIRICLQATYLKFRNKFFPQLRGTAIGTASVVVTNLVIENVEERAIDSFGQPQRVWKQFVDDNFVTLDKVAVDEFFTHLNQIRSSIKFTMEGEILFLDILVTKDRIETIDTNIYRKPTHKEHHLNFKLEYRLEDKFAAVNAFTLRVNSLIRDENEKRLELKHLRNVLTLNGYPNWLLNRKLKTNEIFNLQHPPLAMLFKPMVLRYFPMFQSFQRNQNQFCQVTEFELCSNPLKNLVVY